MITLTANWEIPLSAVFSDVVLPLKLGAYLPAGIGVLLFRFIQTRDKCGQSARRVSSLVKFGK